MPTHHQSGYSIVELLVTLAVAVIAVVIISTMYSSGSRLADNSDDLLIANSLAYAKLQKYENYKYDAIPFSTDETPVEDFSSEIPASLPGTREGKVYIAQISATMKYIFIRVKYGTSAQPHILEYGDFIQTGGLGR